MKRRGHLLVLLLAGFLLFFAGFLMIPLPEGITGRGNGVAIQIEDREGRILREVRSSGEATFRFLKLPEISAHLRSATVFAEDRRFFRHFGVDPLAIARAARENLRAGRIVQGGSTITMQLARCLGRSQARRGLALKLWEILLALRMEIALSKDEILELYLNNIPYGNMVRGVGAASQVYFGKPAAHLSLAEAAALAVIPSAPSRNDPYSDPKRVMALQRELLLGMKEKKWIDEDALQRAMQQEIVLLPPGDHFQAPHFCDYVLSLVRKAGIENVHEVRTTLDVGLQKKVEELLRLQVKDLKDHGLTNAAAVVMDNKTGDILAMAGSADFFDPVRSGQVNGALARRQPGSALKPFLYVMALEKGDTAATLIPDIETQVDGEGGAFRPRNYDERYHGPVRMRTALACSYNVAAVKVLAGVGADAFLRRLKDLGFESLDRSAAHYGLGLTLGSGEVTLLELVQAYRCLARGGLFSPSRAILELRDVRGGKIPLPGANAGKRRVVSHQVAWIITNILSDESARVPSFGEGSPLNLPFPCAAKTGTSKSFRDNWTIGYTPGYTVGVWAGNFDNRPMINVSGVSGAGPLFRKIFMEIEGKKVAKGFPVPEGIERRRICGSSGELPGPYCPNTTSEYFIEGTAPRTFCSVHRLVKIDRRCGLLAAPGCPPSLVEKRIFEVYPPIYRQWMDKVGLPMPPAKISSLGWSRTSGGVDVVFPDDGAVFLIDPVLRREYQTITLKPVVPEGTRLVSWWVDGRQIARLAAPFIATWLLKKGEHTFQVKAEVNGRGEVSSGAVRISVY